jgi:hypothetical protein
MTLMDEPAWRGMIDAGAGFGGAANLEAFTDTCGGTVRALSLPDR